MNTKTRGDVAVGQAISYYLSCGYEVCLPIGDKRNYDLIIEKEGVLQRVQIKYAGFYKDGKCKVGLRITGGNQSYNYTKKYKDDDFEVLFVYTARGESYSIPWSKVKHRNELTIEVTKYVPYKVINA